MHIRKTMWRIAVLLLALVTVITTLVACSFRRKSDDELIRARIDSFLDAYNTGDMEAVLDCLDAKTRNAYKSAINLTETIGGKLTGVNGIKISDIFGLGVGVISESDLLRVEIQQITIEDESSAVVSVMMSYEDITDSFSGEAIFTMLKEDGDWYIKNFEDK